MQKKLFTSVWYCTLRIVVFAAVNVKTTRSLDVTPCSLVYGHLCFNNIPVFAARLISSLNISAASFSQTSVNICQTTRHHIPEYRYLTSFNFMCSLYIRCIHIWRDTSYDKQNVKLVNATTGRHLLLLLKGGTRTS